MKNTHNRWRALTVAIILSYSAVGLAQEYDRDDCGMDDVIFANSPKKFVPFEMVDPKTGEELPPDGNFTITGPDGKQKTYVAKEFFGKLNEIEKSLNKQGYSLRDGGAHTLAQLAYCKELLNSQLGIIWERIKNAPGEALSYDAWKSKFKKAWSEYKQEVGLDKFDFWSELDEAHRKSEKDFYFPSIPPAYSPEVPSLEKEKLVVEKRKSWDFEVGKSSKFLLAGNASLLLSGSTDEVKGVADGKIRVEILDKFKQDILSANAYAIASGKSNSRAGVSFKAFGKELWGPTWSTTNGSVFPKVEKSHQLGIDKSISHRFSIGPVPMMATVGFRGSIGVKYGFEIVPIHVGAYAVPFASADAYAQVGVDVLLVAAGVGGKLVLVKASLPIRGNIGFQYVDEPEFVYNLTGDAELEALSGSLYAYIKVRYPKPWPPFWDEWQGDYDIFTWGGLRKSGNIFKYKAKLTEGGLEAEGDLSAQDFAEIHEINRKKAIEQLEQKSVDKLKKVVLGIQADLNSPQARQAITESSRLKTFQSTTTKHLGNWKRTLVSLLN